MLQNHRGGDRPKFMLWADILFRGGYGALQFRMQASTKVVSKILSVYDEAFIICVVVNAFDRWIYEAKVTAENRSMVKEDIPPTKWTESGSSAKKYEGWDEAGITFFNQTIMEVTKLRDTKASKDLEKEFFQNKQKEREEKKRGGVKRVTVTVTAMNGLDDDDSDSGECETSEELTTRKRARVSIGSSWSEMDYVDRREHSGNNTETEYMDDDEESDDE